MTAREGESAAEDRPQARLADLALAKPPTQRFARLAILASLVLLAAYTGVAVVRDAFQPRDQ